MPFSDGGLAEIGGSMLQVRYADLSLFNVNPRRL